MDAVIKAKWSNYIDKGKGNWLAKTKMYFKASGIKEILKERES